MMGYLLRPKRAVLRTIRIVVLKQTELRYTIIVRVGYYLYFLYLYYDNVYIITTVVCRKIFLKKSPFR